MVEEIIRREIVLDFVLSNREELVKNLKREGDSWKDCESLF